MQLDSGQLEHVLSVWPVARLATLSAQGPQIVPIVFVLIGQSIVSPVDGKPKTTSNIQRIRNVALNANVSVLLDHYDADWRTLWWLRIDGIATVVDGDKLPQQELKRLGAALRRKYVQYESTPVFRGHPTLLRIEPERHAAWSAQPMDWALVQPGTP